MTAPGGTPDAPDDTLAGPRAVSTRGALAPGASLGKYRLERVLGTGGMGVVWAAHDPDLERAVALKVLRYDNAAVELRRRLLREARAMAKLKHPNVLTVYAVESEGDRDFIAMELVEGMSLDRWLAAGPSREAIWQAILAAGRGLVAAHRAGLVHRDFKPHNVLRSDDGRVLVTDFGLARGHAEDRGAAIAMASTFPVAASGLEATLEATPPRPGSDPLEAPLTQTGQLIGTPAYMAPEQFLGAAPDPRTDQFAFCVTAWQLLTGERPFRGATVDELRRAASRGVAQVKNDLPGAIRQVLARGLEADPAKRWPDMDAVLAALERGRARPQRWRRLGFRAFVVALGAVLGIKLLYKPAVVAESVCANTPEDELAKAWSPALRAQVLQRLGDGPGVQHIAGEVDAFAAQWLADYRSTCASPPKTRTFAKLGCLLGERDEVAGLTALIPTVPPASVEVVEMGGVLPRPEACDGDSPVTPPTLPDDPAKRSKIDALRTRLVAGRFEPPARVLAAMPGLVVEAEAVGWDPILAEAHQGFALAARDNGQWDLARDHFKLAAQLARRSHDYHLEAATWSDVLTTELEAVSDPADASEATDLFAQARVAVHNAGDDPVYLAQIDRVEAVVAATRGRLEEALTRYEKALAMELSARDWAAALRIAVEAATLLVMRDRPGDLDAAWAMLLEAERRATTNQLSEAKRRRLSEALTLVAQLRGDLASAHAWSDRDGAPAPAPDAAAISGRVIDADGRGVAGATVVAWGGVLEGDATRVYTRPRDTADIATTGADGAFTVRADKASGIIAALGDRRSRPRLIRDVPITLELATTRAIAGAVIADDNALPGVVVIAHYDLGGGVAWRCTSAVTRAHVYRLAGLPTGDATLRLDTRIDPNRPVRKLDAGPVRDGATLHWPAGPAIDAIVRGGPVAVPEVYVLRGRHTAKTGHELDLLAERADAVLSHPALIIGIGDQTAEGVTSYARGDRHAVFLGNAPGPVTVCAREAEPILAATCRTIEIPRLTGEPRYPAIPVVLSR